MLEAASPHTGSLVPWQEHCRFNSSVLSEYGFQPWQRTAVRKEPMVKPPQKKNSLGNRRIGILCAETGGERSTRVSTPDTLTVSCKVALAQLQTTCFTASRRKDSHTRFSSGTTLGSHAGRQPRRIHATCCAACTVPVQSASLDSSRAQVKRSMKSVPVGSAIRLIIMALFCSWSAAAFLCARWGRAV